MTETADIEVGLAEDVTDHQFVVRLLFKFNASSPEQAVDKMIRELADHGLRVWHYRVEDLVTGEMSFVTGHGEVKSIDSIIADAEDDDTEDDDGSDD